MKAGKGFVIRTRSGSRYILKKEADKTITLMYKLSEYSIHKKDLSKVLRTVKKGKELIIPRAYPRNMMDYTESEEPIYIHSTEIVEINPF